MKLSEVFLEASISAKNIEKEIVDVWNGKKTKDKLVLDIIQEIKRRGASGEAIHTGPKKDGVLSDEWLGRDTTPKADVVIGGMGISVKWGSAQIMSSKADETISTFNAALRKSTSLTKRLEKEIIDIATSIKGGFKEGRVIGEIGPQKETHPVLSKVSKAHKKIQERVEEIFNTSEEFKLKFIEEALTGNSKFDSKQSRANYVLAVHTKDMSFSLNRINAAYVKKLQEKSSINIKFKSDSVKTKEAKPGERSFRSVFGLMYAEEVIYEATVMDKIKSWWGVIKNKFLEFFGFTVQVEGIDKPIEF